MKPNAYQDMTEKFIAQLEQGVRPWSRSWKLGTSASPLSRPLRASGEAYRGVNTVSLWCAGAARGFDSPYWMTFLQAKELGASVKKGAKAEHVFKVGTSTKEKENAAGETEERTFQFLKCYNVFNAQEIEGLPEKFYPAKPDAAPAELEQRIKHVEDFTRRTRAIIRHGGDRAFYAPGIDGITMPLFNAFDSPEAYYATLLHELTHWTAPANRCDRKETGNRFGDSAYAFEELVAELGAAFLCADLKISDNPREDHVSYLASWIKGLKETPRVLMRACGAAERAATYLHGLQASVPAIISPAIAATSSPAPFALAA